MIELIIDGNSLNINQIVDVSQQRCKVTISKKALNKVDKCRDYVEKLISQKKTVYGLNTGFGKFSTVVIPQDKIAELQENLILSHCTGVGKFLSIPETRASTLLRANVLAKGYSGIKKNTLQTLVDMLNSGVHPCIPEKGSVGASGDLAPLSHLALVLLGKGQAEYQGDILPGGKALELVGLKPIKLSAKEGLALNNGTQIMTAISALNYYKAMIICKTADICAAVSLDALKGTPYAYDELIHQVRPYKGQQTVAQNLRNLVKGSPLRQSHLNCSNVQDPYSLRCVPQVHGAVRDALDYVENTILVEINSATDNPLIFADEDRVISGGNFHGEPIAFVADTLGFTISEIASISERRIEQLCNPSLNRGLNAFLAPRPGLDSGFMIAHVTASSLVSENKILAHPASVDSIPTSANQEDHVSMGTIGALKAREIIDNVFYVLGIELMIALQALELREFPSSKPVEAIREEVRNIVAPLGKDRLINDDINSMKTLIESGKLIEIVNSFEELK